MNTYHIFLMREEEPIHFPNGETVFTVEAVSKGFAIMDVQARFPSAWKDADFVSLREDRTPKPIIPIGTVVLNQSLPLMRGLVVDPVRDTLHDRDVMVAWQDGQVCVEQVTDLTDYETGKMYLADGSLQPPTITLPNISAVPHDEVDLRHGPIKTADQVTEVHDHRTGEVTQVRGEAGHHKFCLKGQNVEMPCSCREYPGFVPGVTH